MRSMTNRRLRAAKCRFDDMRNPVLLTQDEIESGKIDYPTWNDLSIYDRTYYHRGRTYILDAPDGNFTKTFRHSTVSMHSQKCNLVEKFFNETTPYEVIPVPSLKDEAAWDRFWTGEMDGWSSEDLIIIYHHGRAGQNGPHYTWRFKTSPYTVNAFDFIEKLCNGPADAQLILECYIPTRFQDRLKLMASADAHRRNVEIVGTGQPGQDDEGNVDDNNYTDQLLKTFYGLTENGPAKKTGTWSRTPASMCSIPQAMRHVNVPGNPYRIWLSMYNQPAINDMALEDMAKLVNAGQDTTTQLWRIRMNPTFISRQQKLIFHKDCIRDSKKELEIAYYRARREHKESFPGYVNFGPDGVDEGFEDQSDEVSAGEDSADAVDANGIP